jgi:hypothetical protein
MEVVMRRFLLAGTMIAALAAVPTVASAQYYSTDPYGAPPVYGYPPPPAYGTATPQAESQVYLAPGQTYVPPPGTAYSDQPIVIEGRRYYRDCWWDWGQRRCELKPWW